MSEATELLEDKTQRVLGSTRSGRGGRIMVTLPSEAATDYEWVRRCAEEGMDIARINSAHDDASAWAGMVANVRRAARETGHPLVVHFDLAGPKLRTGKFCEQAELIKIQPIRDAYGAVLSPARIELTSTGPSETPRRGVARLQVAADWLAQLTPSHRLRVTDARGRKRRLEWSERSHGSVFVTCDRTLYIGSATSIVARPQYDRAGASSTRVSELPQHEVPLRLSAGDEFWLHAEGAVLPEEPGEPLPRVPFTLPEALASIRVGQRVFLDDGKLAASVVDVVHGAARLRLEQPGAGSAALRNDRGINLPDSHLDITFLGAEDRAKLQFATHHADLLGLSFVQSPEDIDAVCEALGPGLSQLRGIVLKIETARSFDALPRLLLRSSRSFNTAVMIARGDLAVEGGWERLAEIQEEILWLSEAAHVPVIWATEVLHQLARTGRATRAEITDAAMSGRAECVMLNKGPHILQAIRSLSDIMNRMQHHQQKKQARLRSLNVSRIA